MKVSELEGAALDWAVAKAVGVPVIILPADNPEERWQVQSGMYTGGPYWPSQDWNQGGALIERYNVLLSPPTSLVHRNFGYMDKRNGNYEAGFWGATIFAKERKYRRASFHHQTSALIAAMRAIVQFELGEEVELPAGLVTV